MLCLFCFKKCCVAKSTLQISIFTALAGAVHGQRLFGYDYNADQHPPVQQYPAFAEVFTYLFLIWTFDQCVSRFFDTKETRSHGKMREPMSHSITALAVQLLLIWYIVPSVTALHTSRNVQQWSR